MDKNFDQHISRQFNQDLDELRQMMMAMGGLVEEMAKSALIAVLEGNTDLAEEVVQADDRVNQMEKRIDKQCNLVIARRQPTASDLRLVFSIIKAISDLERIGDEAEKIARLAIHLGNYERPRSGYLELEAMGQRVLDMLKMSLDGFARLSTDVAIKLIKEDEKVDAAYEAVFRQYYSYMMEDPRHIRRVLDALLIAKALERIGDHCKNIGEYVVYLVEGRDLRHEPKTEFDKLSK